MLPNKRCSRQALFGCGFAAMVVACLQLNLGVRRTRMERMRLKMLSLGVGSILALAIANCRSAPRADCHLDPRTAKPPSNELARLPSSPWALGSVGTGSLIGYLADSVSGMGIPRATVAVRPASGRNHSTHYVVTDSAGGFLLPGLPPGKHSFDAGRPAYMRLRFQATIVAGKLDTVRLRTQISPMYLSCPVVTS